MSDRDLIDAQGRQLSLYHYLEPFFAGRRILEIGCGAGEGAAYMADHGAAAVVSVDTDAAGIEQARGRHRRTNLTFKTVARSTELAGESGFDLIIMSDAAAALRRAGAAAELRRALAPSGMVVALAASADAGAEGGLGFYELKEALASHLPFMRLLGLTPVAGTVVAELDGIGEEPRIDAGLLRPDDDRPTHYVAVAGTTDVPPLGRALVRLPPAMLASTRQAGAATAGLASSLAGEMDAGAEAALRRRLDEALSQAESASRVARAQADEIAELRGRVRRAVEDRALLDEEMSKLRRALAQADETVIGLTRRTAEGIDELASRLKTGSSAARPTEPTVRSDEVTRLQQQLAGAQTRAAALQDGMRKAEEAKRAAEQARDAAQRDRERLLEQARQLQSALDQRDERIAKLEGERQDHAWRISELEERLRRSEEETRVAREAAAKTGELDELNAARERAMTEFHRAAARHVEEVNSLRATVADQAALVSELEENLAAAERKAREAQDETVTLRRSTSELESSDRSRRQRLAELEGKLLRLERERAEAAARPAAPAPASPPTVVSVAPDPALMAEVADLREKLEHATDLIHSQEDQIWQGKERLVASQERIGILENETANLRGQLQAARAAMPSELEPSAGVLKALETVESVENRLREEVQTLQSLEEAVSAVELHGGAPSEASDAGDKTADEVQRLHTVIENFRRLAGRLRDEVDGFAMRAAASSPAEVEVMVDQLRHGLTDIEQG